MTTLILLPQPTKRQPHISTRQYELLQLRNFAFETLLLALQKLDHADHHAFLVRSLTIILDAPDLDKLPIVSLAELLFAVIDNCMEPRAILDLQNVMIYAAQMLEGAYDEKWPTQRMRNCIDGDP